MHFERLKARVHHDMESESIEGLLTRMQGRCSQP